MVWKIHCLSSSITLAWIQWNEERYFTEVELKRKCHKVKHQINSIFRNQLRELTFSPEYYSTWIGMRENYDIVSLTNQMFPLTNEKEFYHFILWQSLFLNFKLERKEFVI